MTFLNFFTFKDLSAEPCVFSSRIDSGCFMGVLSKSIPSSLLIWEMSSCCVVSAISFLLFAIVFLTFRMACSGKKNNEKEKIKNSQCWI